ncbi:MAG TPA: replication-relaxation family protein [Acidimicrobiales bacterium]
MLGRITERDRQLCRLLEDHRVLTTAQVADVGFTGERRARTRLSEFYALDALERFRPRIGTNLAPYHWVLGPLGAALVAAEAGADVAELDWRRGLVHDLASSQRLTHLVGVNGFFTALLRSARTRSGCQLEEWWSERRCRREWGEVVRPDGYGVWVEHGTSMPFLLEHDNGTERLARLAQKLVGYANLALAAGHPNWVLFTFPTPRRELDARRVLAHDRVPVATTARTPDFTPDDAEWLPVGDPGPRSSLFQLAGFPFERGRPV